MFYHCKHSFLRCYLTSPPTMQALTLLGICSYYLFSFLARDMRGPKGTNTLSDVFSLSKFYINSFLHFSNRVYLVMSFAGQMNEHFSKTVVRENFVILLFTYIYFTLMITCDVLSFHIQCLYIHLVCKVIHTT